MRERGSSGEGRRINIPKYYYADIRCKNSEGPFCSGANFRGTNHPSYGYQIPFGDIVLCNMALSGMP